MTQKEAEAILREAGKIMFSSTLVHKDPRRGAIEMTGAQAVGLVLWQQLEFEPRDAAEAALYVWDILMDELQLNVEELTAGGTR